VTSGPDRGFGRSFEDFLAGGGDPDDPDAASRPAPGSSVLSVSEVARRLRERLRAAPDLRDVWVEGEIGSVSVSAAGHAYLTLKDERAQLQCVLFREERLASAFEPRTGLHVIAHGRLDLFEAQGKLQLYLDSIAPAGVGDLALRFEELKARLMAEGLFDPARKRSLPPWPRRIGVVTSPTGAVLHDIHQVLARRWPIVELVLSPTLVQGPEAPREIAAAIGRITRWRDPQDGRGVDLVIVARGGGSAEDLWAFNEEVVVRAVAASPLPTIVGVGHETDTTLAEFAADRRAPTPSVAAEIAVPDRAEQTDRVRAAGGRLGRSMIASLAGARRELDAERRALEGFRPIRLLQGERERAGLLLDRATRATLAGAADRRGRLVLLEGRLGRAGVRPAVEGRAALDAAAAALHALGPAATLARGYAIVRDARGRVVRQASAVAPGDPLLVTLGEGSLDVRVDGVRDSAG